MIKPNIISQPPLLSLSKGERSSSFRALLVFLDVTGFTALTETASASGYYGIEIILKVLNRYFERLATLVYSLSGEIDKYGGDSCLIIFDLDDPDKPIPDPYILRDRIYQLCKELNDEFMRDYHVGFQVHGAMHSGNVNLHIIGDRKYHWDYYYCGDALDELYALAEKASGSNILMGVLDAVDVEKLNRETILTSQNRKDKHLPLSDKEHRREWQFLPASVRTKIRQEPDVAELRNAAILFIHLSDFEIHSQDKPVPNESGKRASAEQDELNRQLDLFYCQIQRWVYEFDGVINKVLNSEKGFLVIATFGIPFVHTDDIERAFLCARRLCQIQNPILSPRIGITYSNLFAGIIGSSFRYEYGIIGSGVNIAARLMSQAPPGGINFTREIVPRISSRFETTFVCNTNVKGIAGKIDIFQVSRELPENWNAYAQRFISQPLVICEAELKKALKRLQDIPGGGCQAGAEDSYLLTISGESGSGKSYLLWYLLDQLKKDGIGFDFFTADNLASNFRLEFWFGTLRRKLNIEQFRSEFQILVDWCRQRNIQFDQELLKQYLFTSAQPKTRGRKAKNKTEINKESNRISEANQNLIKQVMGEIVLACYEESCILAFDNYQSFDAESIELIEHLIRHKHQTGARIIICKQTSASRDKESADDNMNPETSETENQASDDYSPARIDLKHCTPDQSKAYISHFIPNISEGAISALHRISAGNPGFLSELVKQILVHFPAGRDLISENVIRDLQARGLIPDNLENLLLSRFQSLNPEPRHILKAASIYGRPFTAARFERIFPDINLSNHILNELENLALLAPVDFLPEPLYAFVNPLQQESIYRSILLSEKIELHTTIARYLEETAALGDTSALESIAYHYIQAQNKEKIRIYAGLLASSYFESAAYELSKYYYTLLISVCKDASEVIAYRLRLAEIELLTANNASAEAILSELKQLIFANEQDGIPGQELTGSSSAFETYLLLYTRFLNNTSRFAEIRTLLDEYLPRVKTPANLAMLKLNYMEALHFSGEIDEFTRQAPLLYSEFEQASNLKCLSFLAGSLAQFYMNQGMYNEAAGYYDAKYKHAKAMHDPVGERIGCLGLGNAFSRSGKKAKALSYYQKALKIAGASGDRNGYSKVLLDLGAWHRNNGNYEEAIACYEKSLLLAEYINNKMQISIILYDIGELNTYLDRLDTALEYIERSLAIAKEIEDYTGMSFCWDAIGDLTFKQGDPEKAKAIYLENLELQKRINDREGMAHTWGNLGNVAKSESDFSTARKYYYMQKELLHEVEDWDGSGRAMFNLAMLDIEEGNPSSAKTKLLEARELFTRCSAQFYIEITDQQLAGIEN